MTEHVKPPNCNSCASAAKVIGHFEAVNSVVLQRLHAFLYDAMRCKWGGS